VTVRRHCDASRPRDAAAVAAVALAARLAVVAWAHGRFPPSGDGHYYDTFARRLAHGNGYTWLWPDGAVTFAAHYPVGYPGLLAAAYAVFGASGTVAMTVNALLGAGSAYAIYGLIGAADPAAAKDRGRFRPAGAGLAVALHPALVPYTAAVMTEGVTASLLVIAAAMAGRGRRGGRLGRWLVAAGVVMGFATLVRPQSLLLAPLFGIFAVPVEWGAGRFMPWARRALASGLVLTAVALACVAPWTARNCVRMHRCALVSVNGGWNLLIGATTATGGWQPVAVPAACATVWDEAGKDACFERSAWAEIAQAPGAWIARAPAKVAMTLDYFGAAPWYLNTSNGTAFDGHAKIALGALETLASRLLLLGALVACGRMEGARRLLRKGTAFAGSVAALTLHAWLGYLAIPACIAMTGWRAVIKAPMIVPSAAGVIAATVAVHALFFGAGRYGLVVAPFVAGLAFVDAAASRSDPPEAPDR
jgi:hypothetical protein